jgi:hypothetical protein
MRARLNLIRVEHDDEAVADRMWSGFAVATDGCGLGSKRRGWGWGTWYLHFFSKKT